MRKITAAIICFALASSWSLAQVPSTGPMVPIGGARSFNCSSGTCTTVSNGSYVFQGPDGTTQFSTGATNSAAEYLQAIGGITGAGGSIIAIGAASNIAINFTAKGNANVNFGNSGSGQLVQAVDPGAPVSSGGQVQIGPQTSGQQAYVGNSTYGINLLCGTASTCQAGGSPIQTAGGVYAFNVNGDFQIDQPNEGASNGSIGNARATDGWFGVSTNGGTALSYIRSTTVPTTIGAFSTSGQFTVGSAQTISSTSDFSIYSTVFAWDIAPALWGTANAKPLTLDACMMSPTASLTYPASIGVSLNNNAGGSSYYSFVHNVVLPAANTWTCTSIPITGPTAGFAGPTGSNRIPIKISLGCGSTLQTPQTDAWVGPTTNYTCSSAQTQLAATAGAVLYVTGVHLRYGGHQNYQQSPFQQLPYGIELLRARQRYWKSFAQGTKPAQNVGANTGEIQFPAGVASTGTERAQSIRFDPPMVNAFAPTVTFYNPSAANANCRDETAGADGGAPTAGNATSSQASALTISCAGNASTAVNNLMGVHVVVDSGQ